MTRQKRLGNVLHLVLLLSLTLAVLAGSAGPGYTAAANAEAQELSLEATRQAYELLLDRFVYPLEPAALLTAAWTAAQPALAEAKSTADLTPPAFPEDRAEAWRLFHDRLSQAWESSTGIDPQSKLTHPMIQAMAALANEGHTAFRTPSEYQDYLSWQRNDERYEGIGVSFRGKNYVILEVFPGSPAEAAGLRSGDQILGADGANLTGTELEEGRRRIRGPAGTQVELLIKRASIPEPFTVIVVRAQIKIEPVRWKIIDSAGSATQTTSSPPDIGYLRIVGFPHPSVVTDVDKALDAFEEAGVRAIVLDLRGNGGGRLDVGLRIASKFIASGPIFEQVSREGQLRTVNTIGGYREHSVPLAVLTDGGTASMGEILSSALRENGVATLFGARTAGIVSAAQVFPLVDGSGLQVTILEIRSGHGEKMNEIGVTPDVTVEFTPADAEAGRDPQMEQAIDWLQAQPGYIASLRVTPAVQLPAVAR